MKCKQCGKEMQETIPAVFECKKCNICYGSLHLEEKIIEARKGVPLEMVFLNIDANKDLKLTKIEKENKILQRALELACERIKNMYDQEQQYCTNEISDFVEVEKNYFIDQVRKELGEKDERN